jgi:outer membrane protein OmpA-like peptidoglycan-associated protein
MTKTNLLLALLALILISACHTTRRKHRKSLSRLYFELKDSLAGASVRYMKDSVKVIFPEDVMFPFNSAEIIADFKPQLNRFSKTLNRYVETDILITGFTDNTGEQSFNLDLSKQRAESVKTYMLSKSILPQRLKTWGLGEKNPIYPNNTPEGRAKNRRVEFVILYADQ